MSRPVNINETLTFNPTGYTGTSNLTISTSNGYANGYTNTSSTTYAQFTVSTSTTGYTYYTFTISGIPSNATISSVSCTAKIRVSSTSRVTNTNIQLYTGTTAKGSSTTFASTSASNIVTVNGGSSWTIAEVNNIRLRFGGTGSTSSYTKAIYFYGANLSVTYSIQGTEYEIISTLSTDKVDSIDPAGQTYVVEGNDYELSIYADSIDDVIVEDNGVDVTNQLVRHQTQQGENTISKTADSFTTGFSGGSSMNFYTSSSSTGNNFNYAVGHTAESPGSTSSGNGSWTYVKEDGDSTNNTGYADFVFDFSEIPANAIIKSVQVKCYGAIESTSESTSHADITLFSGSNQKGTMQKFTSSTNSIITISSPGTWTRAELQSAKLRFAVGYYGGHIFGITWNVTYEIPVDNPYYWTYTITNIQADHNIEIGDSYVGPKYLINTSIRTNECSVNNASVKQKEGTDFTLIIYYSDINNLIVTDNGVNVNSSITGSSGTYYYALTNLSADHYIIINEKPWYEVTIESLYSSATASVSSYKVYEGGSFTATVNVSNISLVVIKDNGVDVTSQFTRVSSGVYRASYSNVNDDHEFIVIEANSYSINSVSNTPNASISPAGTSSVSEDSSMTFTITTDLSSDLLILKDNGVDVTSNLTYVSTGTASSDTSTFIPSSFDSVNSTYGSIYEGTAENGLTAHTDSNRFCIYVEQTAYAEAKLIYNFDCSQIPANAIITSVTCIASAACYSSGQYFDTKTLQLYSGNTAKGTAVTITGNGGTRTEHNINGGSWTRSELNNAKIVVYIQRGNNTTQASASFWGATLTVAYEIPGGGYYQYTLSNINEDHTVALYEVFIPEEEDPQKTYYSISVSSINATTNPANGTIRVEEGDDQTIVIVPTETNITLATDNGVDITDQLTGGTGTYDITTQVSGASYGFSLNSSTGYYVSTNNGVSKSASVARINFHMQTRCLVTIEYINYAEANYDYGMFGKVDTEVATDGLSAGNNSSSPSDSTSNYQLAMASNSQSAQTITYTIEKGEHFVDIKYGKDDASNSGNDSLQWKILSVEPLESTDLSYTINNIDEDHSLIFVFGEVVYYTVNTCGEGCKTYPTGDVVVLPNNGYSVTIMSDYDAYDLTIYDNGRDVTKNAEYFETDRANYYVYAIKKTTSDHTIIVVCTEKANALYIKISNNWIQATKVYKKISGVWVEQTDYTTVFDQIQNQIYVSGN
jgi:hypothetical protein